MGNMVLDWNWWKTLSCCALHSELLNFKLPTHKYLQILTIFHIRKLLLVWTQRGCRCLGLLQLLLGLRRFFPCVILGKKKLSFIGICFFYVYVVFWCYLFLTYSRHHYTCRHIYQLNERKYELVFFLTFLLSGCSWTNLYLHRLHSYTAAWCLRMTLYIFAFNLKTCLKTDEQLTYQNTF